jgi:hypothetical protein
VRRNERRPRGSSGTLSRGRGRRRRGEREERDPPALPRRRGAASGTDRRVAGSDAVGLAAVVCAAATTLAATTLLVAAVAPVRPFASGAPIRIGAVPPPAWASVAVAAPFAYAACLLVAIGAAHVVASGLARR